MQRYAGEDLGAAPHIAVLGSCKVGNFVVSTPVLVGLRNRFPDAIIGFLGSEVTADFERVHSAIDWRVSWDDPNPDAGVRLFNEIVKHRSQYGPFSLAINLDGFNPLTCSLASLIEPAFVAGGTLDASRRRPLSWGGLPQQKFLGDSDWDSPEFFQRYRHHFRSGYIAELFAQLAFVADYCDSSVISIPSESPGFTVPDVLVHVTTARAAKVWPVAYWRTVINFLSSSGLSVGLVGSPPLIQKSSYNSNDGEEWLLGQTSLIDLRGRTSLIQLAGACAETRAVLSVDAGPLHISAAMGTPTLAIVGNDKYDRGASPIRLWLPRCTNVNRTVSTYTCELCAQNQFRNDTCIADEHHCMLGVHPTQVMEWLSKTLGI